MTTRGDRAAEIASAVQIATALIAVPALAILGHWMEIPRWAWWAVLLSVGWSFLLMFALAGLVQLTLFGTLLWDLAKGVAQAARWLWRAVNHRQR